MTEGTLKSVDPFLYHVNNIGDFDSDIVVAFRSNDNQKKQRLLDVGKNDVDLFICVNKGYHAFVLCSTVPSEDQVATNIGPDISRDPFDIPGLLLVFTFELCFESEANRSYKIRKQFEYFKDVKERVNRSYYIGRYRDVSAKALQFAALAASPKSYRVMLDDCVEFAKSFCIELLSYCSNWKILEKHVDSQILKATASGLSAEKLSRRIKSSAAVMNTLLGGSDVTSWFSSQSRNSPLMIVFILIYPIVVAVMVSLIVIYFMK